MKKIFYAFLLVGLSTQLSHSAQAGFTRTSVPRGELETSPQVPFLLRNSAEIVDLDPDTIGFLRDGSKIAAERDGVAPEDLEPIIPYEYTFKWHNSSHQYSRHSLKLMDAEFMDETAGFERLIGNAQFLHILDLAIDDPRAVRRLTSDEMSAIADSEISNYLMRKEVARGQDFFLKNQERRRKRIEGIPQTERAKDLISPEDLREFTREKIEKIMEKHEARTRAP